VCHSLTHLLPCSDLCLLHPLVCECPLLVAPFPCSNLSLPSHCPGCEFHLLTFFVCPDMSLSLCALQLVSALHSFICPSPDLSLCNLQQVSASYLLILFQFSDLPLSYALQYVSAFTYIFLIMSSNLSLYLCSAVGESPSHSLFLCSDLFLSLYSLAGECPSLVHLFHVLICHYTIQKVSVLTCLVSFCALTWFSSCTL
jgi:hypothetical protein